MNNDNNIDVDIDISASKTIHNTASRSVNVLRTVCIILSVAIIALLCICIFLTVKLNRHSDSPAPVKKQVIINNEPDLQQLTDLASSASDNAVTEIKDIIRTSMSSDDANVGEMLRNLYPEYIVYADSSHYRFDTISDTISHNDYKRENVSEDEDGFITYTFEDGHTAAVGIDVSQHQGIIDWQAVADYGIEFAIIRVGFRGYGSGALVEDEQFVANIEGACKAGIPVGVYFFSQAIDKNEINEEVDFILEAIAPYKVTLPVVIDIEKVEDSNVRGNDISRDDRTALVKIYCERIADAGYTPMIYGNTFSLFAMLNMEELSEYAIWYAFYNGYIYYPYEMNIWQYGDKLTIPGIEGTCDMDLMMK